MSSENLKKVSNFEISVFINRKAGSSFRLGTWSRGDVGVTGMISQPHAPSSISEKSAGGGQFGQSLASPNSALERILERIQKEVYSVSDQALGCTPKRFGHRGAWLCTNLQRCQCDWVRRPGLDLPLRVGGAEGETLGKSIPEPRIFVNSGWSPTPSASQISQVHADETVPLPQLRHP